MRDTANPRRHDAIITMEFPDGEAFDRGVIETLRIRWRKTTITIYDLGGGRQFVGYGFGRPLSARDMADRRAVERLDSLAPRGDEIAALVKRINLTRATLDRLENKLLELQSERTVAGTLEQAGS